MNPTSIRNVVLEENPSGSEIWTGPLFAYVTSNGTLWYRPNITTAWVQVQLVAS